MEKGKKRAKRFKATQQTFHFEIALPISSEFYLSKIFVFNF